MANTINYAELFANTLDQKYKKESITAGIDGVSLKFTGAKTVKLPTISVPGYKTHSRQGGWNRQDISNEWTPYKLEFDRDVEFFVDAEDVNESNMTVATANITNEFETEQGIPEWDKYTLSTIYERVTNGSTGVASKTFSAIDETDVSKIVEGVLAKIEAMVDKNVDISKLQIRGKVSLTSVLRGIRDGNVQITGVDAIKLQSLKSYLLQAASIIDVPTDRLFTEYDFTSGAVGVGTTGKKKIQLMFSVPNAIARPLKRTKIYLKGEGNTDGDEGDGYTYRNRKYFDVFVLKNKVDGVEFFIETLA